MTGERLDDPVMADFTSGPDTPTPRKEGARDDLIGSMKEKIKTHGDIQFTGIFWEAERKQV